MRSVKVWPKRRRHDSRNCTGRATIPNVWAGAGLRGPAGRPRPEVDRRPAAPGVAVATSVTSTSAGEALEGRLQLVDLLVGLGPAGGHRLANAVIGVIGEQLQRDAIEGPLDR